MLFAWYPHMGVLKSFSEQDSDRHVQVQVHSTTAVARINQMVTCDSQDINRLELEIWQWCIQHNVG